MSLQSTQLGGRGPGKHNKAQAGAGDEGRSQKLLMPDGWGKGEAGMFFIDSAKQQNQGAQGMEICLFNGTPVGMTSF